MLPFIQSAEGKNFLKKVDSFGYPSILNFFIYLWITGNEYRGSIEVETEKANEES